MRLQFLTACALFAGLLAVPPSLTSAREKQCGTNRLPDGPPTLLARAHGHAAETIGGKFLPSQGVIRILLVFASFPDDLTPHPYWPSHQPPLGMQDFLDPDTTSRSTAPHNLTHYFRQMSLGGLHVIGDVLWVESARSQEEYRNGAYGRANSDILKERVDTLVNFSRYDSWTVSEPFRPVQGPDSVVDMVVMVWRTTMFEYLGEASLGYRTAVALDGVRIEMGFPERYDYPRGSGVTCEYPYTDSPGQALRTMVHELGHWLLGGPHPYNSYAEYGKHEYWGMLCTSRRVSSCANSYERERLGWISVPELLPGTTVPLADYLLTGDARKIHLPGGDDGEYFYLENHQRLTPFDDVSVESGDRGLWILHQNGPYFELDNIRIRPSDGNWTWPTAGSTSACFGQTLPLFTRGQPLVLTGSSHRDMLSSPTSAVEWMYAFGSPPAPVRCGRFFGGEGFRGAFRADSFPLFSPYTNPSSATWANVPTAVALEVLSDSGGTVALRFHSTPLDAPPSRRYLGCNPGIAPGTGVASLAWGEQWTGGQPLEPDVQASELQQKVGPGGFWTTVYTGPATSWTDLSLPYDTAGTIPVTFRVRVRDLQGLFSPWSDPLTLMVNPPVRVQLSDQPTLPEVTVLEPVYPNPFNGAATITFRLADPGAVTVQILDLLGREVVTAADGKYTPGRYSTTWDGRDSRGSVAGSGVYIVRLQAGGRSFIRKILVLR